MYASEYFKTVVIYQPFTHLREPSVRFTHSHLLDESKRIGHLVREDAVYYSIGYKKGKVIADMACLIILTYK